MIRVKAFKILFYRGQNKKKIKKLYIIFFMAILGGSFEPPSFKQSRP